MPNTREKLIELLFDCVSKNLTPRQTKSDRLTIEIHHGDIADHLIANDVVPVVRCKDCRYGKIDDEDFPNQYLCKHNGCDWNNGEHFCSYGERREGE